MRVCVRVPLQDLEERLRQQHHMELQSLREAHRQKIETLKQQSEQELQTLRFELEDEGKAMLGKRHGDEAQAERTSAACPCRDGAADMNFINIIHFKARVFFQRNHGAKCKKINNKIFLAPGLQCTPCAIQVQGLITLSEYTVRKTF